MQEKTEVQETVEWNNDNHDVGVMTHESKMPVYDSATGEIKGYSHNTIVTEVKKEDLVANLNDREQKLMNIKADLDDKRAELSQIGTKRPVKTAEQIRIEAALENIRKQRVWDQLTGQIDNLQRQYDDEIAHVIRRRETMARHPDAKKEEKPSE